MKTEISLKIINYVIHTFYYLQGLVGILWHIVRYQWKCDFMDFII